MLREHLEAIRDRNAGVEGSIDDSPFDYADAVASLAILDEAGFWDRNHYMRLVPDPAPPTENT